MSEVLTLIQEGGAAVALIVAIVLFLKGLKDQRQSFQQMIAEQNAVLRETAAQSVAAINRNTAMLGRVDAHLPAAGPSENSGVFIRASP